MKLPGSEGATVDERKVRDYLLSLAKENPAEPAETTRYGQKYLVRGILSGPESEAAVQTVWIVPVSEELPRLVSAYPGEHP